MTATTTSRDKLIELIAAQMHAHRRVGNQCSCGWSVTPMLDSTLRVHVAESILASVVLAIAQVNAENIFAVQEAVVEDARRRTHAAGLLLIDSGDMTPAGASILDNIWNNPDEVTGDVGL